LTHKKPETVKSGTGVPSREGGRRKRKVKRVGVNGGGVEGDGNEEGGEGEALWAVGEDSDEELADTDQDDDVDHHQNPLNHQFYRDERRVKSASADTRGGRGGEEMRLVEAMVDVDDEEDRDRRRLKATTVERIASASNLNSSSGRSRRWR
jgi:hypothetical protein